MALDPSIILQGRAPQLPDVGQLVQLRNLSLAGENAQLNLDASKRDAMNQRTLAGLYQKHTKADGTIDTAGMQADMAGNQLGAQIPAFQKATADASMTRAKNEGEQLTLQKQKLDLVNGALSGLLAQPQVSHDQVISTISSLVDRGVIDNQQGLKMVQTLPGPDQLRSFLVSKAVETMDASKRLEVMLPKYDEQDRGGTISQGTIDPLTGQRNEGTNVVKTATPGEKLTAAAKAATGARVTFTPEEGDLMGALAERGVNLPAGLRSREQMKSTFGSLLARNPNLSPDDIAEKIATGQINLASERKSTQTAAALEGRIAVAQNEVQQFIPLARAASQALPRGEFVPWNKLSQYSDEQLSSPQLAEFKAYMTTLSNAYDQLAARGGTDADKRAHNRKMFDTAQSPEALEAVFTALTNEAKAAATAAHQATQRRSPGHGAAPAAATPSGATVSNW